MAKKKIILPYEHALQGARFAAFISLISSFYVYQFGYSQGFYRNGIQKQRGAVISLFDAFVSPAHQHQTFKGRQP